MDSNAKMSNLNIILQEQFLGKRVEILIPERDNYGKEHPTKLTSVEGIVGFIGVNPLFEPLLQVTIDRVPFRVKHINHIKLKNGK